MLLDTGMASNDNKGYVRWQRHYSYSSLILAIILLSSTSFLWFHFVDIIHKKLIAMNFQFS